MITRHCLPVLAAALCVGLSGPAHAADAETTSAAEALIDSMDMPNLLGKSMESALDAQMGQFSQMGIPPAGVAELKTAMLSFMKEVMQWEELRPEFVRIYSESFTAAELRELTAFYRTPTGKKAITLIPDLMSKGMIVGQQRVQARAAELQQRITPIIQKHLPQR